MITVGYDVGGAHLKVARTRDGRIEAVRQIACPLWQGLDDLDNALAEATDIRTDADRHIVTMTGELTEIFPSRQAGCVALIRHLSNRLGPNTLIYAGLKGLLAADAASACWTEVGSANFLASASLIAQSARDCVVIDMGSTTTDIIVCHRPFGLTDAERLQTGELVYTGLTRTPVPSVTTRAPLAGQWQTLARDTFATMADVRRVRDELADGLDLHDTVDGKSQSRRDSLARFARGFGRDISDADVSDASRLGVWTMAAGYVCDRQIQSMSDGLAQVLSRPGSAVHRACVAGIGHEVAREVARRAGLPSDTFAAYVNGPSELSQQITAAAPAVAVAVLGSDRHPGAVS